MHIGWKCRIIGRYLIARIACVGIRAWVGVIVFIIAQPWIFWLIHVPNLFHAGLVLALVGWYFSEVLQERWEHVRITQVLGPWKQLFDICFMSQMRCTLPEDKVMQWELVSTCEQQRELVNQSSARVSVLLNCCHWQVRPSIHLSHNLVRCATIGTDARVCCCRRAD